MGEFLDALKVAEEMADTVLGDAPAETSLNESDESGSEGRADQSAPDSDDSIEDDAEASADIDTDDDDDQPDTDDDQPDDQDSVETFTLPDGRQVSAEDIVKAFEQTSEEPKDDRELLKAEILKELKQTQEPPQQPTQATKPTIDPFHNSNDWMRARWNEYTQAGQKPTVEQVRTDLLQAQNYALYIAQQEVQQREAQKHMQHQAEVQKQQRQTQIEQIASQYNNLQGDTGKKLLNMAIAHAEANGETDINKVVREANEFVGSFVKEKYINTKKEKLRLVRNKLPSGGNIKAPVPKQDKMKYTGFESVTDMLRSALDK